MRGLEYYLYNVNIVSYLVTSYYLFYIGDNLDKTVKRRHMTRSRQNVSLHMFNAIAVKNRVPFPHHLIGIPANLPTCSSDVNFEKYYPNKTDESCLLEELRYLFAKNLLNYTPELNWAKPFVKRIEHEYTEFTSRKSEVVSMIGQ